MTGHADEHGASLVSFTVGLAKFAIVKAPLSCASAPLLLLRELRRRYEFPLYTSLRTALADSLHTFSAVAAL